MVKDIFKAENRVNGRLFRKLSLLPLMLMLLMTAVSCTERIDIKLDDSYTRLVVEGQLSTDTMAHAVVLTTTTSYYDPQAPPPVQGATVTLFDGKDTTYLTETRPGYYMTEPDFYGVPGKNYTLNIRLREPIGGHSDYSAQSFLHPVAPLDSIGMQFHGDWGSKGVWDVKCYVMEPPTVDYYRFLIYKNHELFTKIIRYWFVTDDKFFNGVYAKGATVSYFRQDNEHEILNAGDTITVEADNITKEYYNYVLEVQTEVQGTNPLFGGPPANVKGNISNGAIGFFSTFDLTRKSTITPSR
ncbi:MAG: DUF4249 domain-containing protein [Bacteroidetes bacterium]|nr:DUF4249 domain-containing protein [Bacteroidota bacterium]